MTSAALPQAAHIVSAGPQAATKGDLPSGLTSDEARRRMETCGPNAMPDTGMHPIRMDLDKLWAPVPWMLEAAEPVRTAHGGNFPAEGGDARGRGGHAEAAAVP